MAHVSDYQTKAVKKASREAVKDFKGWTKVVPAAKTKKPKKLTTQQYLKEAM